MWVPFELVLLVAAQARRRFHRIAKSQGPEPFAGLREWFRCK
jgi:hypothetical protein